jgi:hypothetical protein
MKLLLNLRYFGQYAVSASSLIDKLKINIRA